MTDAVLTHGEAPSGAPKLSGRPPIAARIVFLVLLVGGLAYCINGLRNDIVGVNETIAFGVFALLGLALLIALASSSSTASTTPPTRWRR